MSIIGAKLRIKYKLIEIPTDDQVAGWVSLVDQLRLGGMEVDEAGRLAARHLFAFDDNLLLKADADTIESLLEQARRK